MPNEQSIDGMPFEGVVLTGKNQPFASVGKANQRRTELMTEHPGDSFSIVPYKEGFALIKTVLTPDEEKRAESGGQTVDDGMSEYVRVVFDAKTDPHEPDDVFLGHNGDMLYVQREQVVVIPRKFLEVAEHTTRQRVKQVPGETRKVIGYVKTFTHRYLGPGTKEEYQKMKTEGTSALKNSIVR